VIITKDERKRLRKAHKDAERARKLLISAQRGINSVKGRIIDPVWHALAERLARDPDTDPALAMVLSEAIVIRSVEVSVRTKKHRAKSLENRKREERSKAEQDAKVQAVLDRKEKLSLDAWCLYLAEYPDARSMVGVRNRPVRITRSENAVLKSKIKEVASRQYIYRTTLIKRRGWTPELVDAALGAPDKTIVNRHYVSGPKAMLYRLDRVQTMERL
jgi:hypothetical protein